jgi:hypothetical protein
MKSSTVLICSVTYFPTTVLAALLHLEGNSDHSSIFTYHKLSAQQIHSCVLKLVLVLSSEVLDLIMCEERELHLIAKASHLCKLIM